MREQNTPNLAARQPWSAPMELTVRICRYLLIASLSLFCGPIDSAQPAMLRDGQHDFDFEIGKWKAHVKKLSQPLSDSKQWEDYDGSVVTTPFMEGKGNLSEMNV